MSQALEAAFWGFVGGGALVIGAAIGYLGNVPSRAIAGVMAFGSGVLISALSFELMEEAFEQAGLASIVFAVMVAGADLPGADAILAAVAWTIVLSVVGHGLSANPLASIYGARAEKRAGTI